jgi:methionine synthase I (cobalamin-dependent)
MKNQGFFFFIQIRFVAGSIGPTNRVASISPNVDDASARAVSIYFSLFYSF